MPTPFWRCAKCGREHPKREDAANCEKFHLAVRKARALRYTVSAYPYTIEVTFTDGSTKVYRWEELP